MNKIKLLIAILFLALSTLTVSIVSAKSLVETGKTESAYTLSEALYDEETGKLKYLKISYSTAPVASSNGEPKEGDDYVFIPAKYFNFTNDTQVSIKYKNNGVKKIVMNAEYAPGVTESGSEYAGGSELICVDALGTAWNSKVSKTADGYDMLTVSFGNYTTGQYDFLLEGFRLYFDLGSSVNSLREFEIYGCEVHEKGDTPKFVTDPDTTTRFTKLISDDTEVHDGEFTVNGSAIVSTKFLNYVPNYYKVLSNIILDNPATLNVYLDHSEIPVITKNLIKGKNAISIPLDVNKEVYAKLEFEFITTKETNINIVSLDLVNKPTVTNITASSSIKVTTVEEGTKLSWTYKTGWSTMKCNIKGFTTEHTSLVMNFTLEQPTVIGIKLDGVWLRSHYVYSDPISAGEQSLTFDLTSLDVKENSQIEMWLDPAITGYNGLDGTKTITFTSFEFITAVGLPDATITVDPLFEFEYDGKGKEASGATSNSGGNITYEYKLEYQDEEKYSTTLPVNAGTYDVRVVSGMTKDYAKTYAYSKLVISKITPEAPKSDVVTVNYSKNTISYDQDVYQVSSNSEFTKLIANGGKVEYGMTLYVKHINSNNFNESEATSFALDKREGTVSYSINYVREMTVESIPDTVEYSIDGYEWISGENKRMSLVPGTTYQFRLKATSDSFAGEVFDLVVDARRELTEQLVLVSTTNTSITVNSVEGAEYRLSDTVWQDSPTFDYLKEGDTVVVYMRLKGSNTIFASNEVMLEVVVGTMPEAPVTPEVTPEASNNGCDGSVVASIIGLLTLTGCVLVLRKKKQD